MRTVALALSAAIALFSAAPTFAVSAPIGDADVNGQPPASHTPVPEPDARRHEPPDPCRRFHTRRAHARCEARLHVVAGQVDRRS